MAEVLLSQDTFKYVMTVCSHCVSLNINEVFISSEAVTGVSSSRDLLFISLPSLDETFKLGIPDVKMFILRMNLIYQNSASCTIRADKADSGDIKTIFIKNGRNMSEFRCKPTAKMQIFKKMPPIVNHLCFSENAVKLITEARRAMGMTEEDAMCTMFSDEGMLVMRLIDASNQECEIVVGTVSETINPVKYRLKYVIPCIDKKPTNTGIIGNGSLAAVFEFGTTFCVPMMDD